MNKIIVVSFMFTSQSHLLNYQPLDQTTTMTPHLLIPIAIAALSGVTIFPHYIRIYLNTGDYQMPLIHMMTQQYSS